MGRRSKVDYDSIEYRRKLWDKEYLKSKDLPSTNTLNPSTSLRNFLQKYNQAKELAIDIGSGNGRNSIYLKQSGFNKIIGIELSKVAVEQSLKKIKELNLNGIEIFNSSIESGIPTSDNSADLVIDMMSMHSFSEKERIKAFEEIRRVLKPGGTFLFFTLERNSPAAQDLIKKWKGLEDGSYRFEIDEIVHTEKTFLKEELEKELSPLIITEWEESIHNTKAFNNIYTRVYVYGVAKKRK